jgi:hypothetical protein
MWKDEIVDEVRKVREAHAAAHGHNLKRIFEDLKQKQDASGKKAVALQPRPPRALGRASSGAGR